MDLRIDIVDAPSRSLVAEWKDFLKTRARERRIEHEPAFLEAERLLHPERPPLLLVARRNGTIVGLGVAARYRGPVELSLSVVRIRKIPAWTLKLFGDDFVYAEGEAEEPIARAMLGALAERGPRIDLVTLPELREGSALERLFREEGARIFGFSLETSSADPEVTHRAHLPGTLDELLARLSKDQRARMRKALKLGDSGSVRIEEFRSEESVPRFLALVEELYPRTWQGRTFGPRPRSRAHLEHLAKSGLLRAHVLFEGDRPIAFSLGYQYEGTYTYEEPGYDVDYASKSPGFTLLALIIEQLYREDPAAIVDFGFGDNHYKRIFSTERLAVRSAALVRPLFYRSLFRAQRAASRVYATLRHEAVRLGIDAQLRALLKHRSLPAARAAA